MGNTDSGGYTEPRQRGCCWRYWRAPTGLSSAVRNLISSTDTQGTEPKNMPKQYHGLLMLIVAPLALALSANTSGSKALVLAKNGSEHDGDE